MKNNEVSIEFALESIDSVIEKHILPRLPFVQVITFEGTLGAGKTTFIKHLIKKLGCSEMVTSPTFNYVNQYDTDFCVVQHFDLYRLESNSAFEEMGLSEQVNIKSALSLIEWPAVAFLSMQGLRKEGKVLALEFLYDPSNLNIRWLKIK